MEEVGGRGEAQRGGGGRQVGRQAQTEMIETGRETWMGQKLKLMENSQKKKKKQQQNNNNTKQVEKTQLY